MRRVRKKIKPLHVLRVINKSTGLIHRVLTFRDYNEALRQKEFYCATTNLIAHLESVLE